MRAPTSAPLPRELPRSSCTSPTLSRASETFLFPSVKLTSRLLAESKRPVRRSPSFVRTTIFCPGESACTADQSAEAARGPAHVPGTCAHAAGAWAHADAGVVLGTEGNASHGVKCRFADSRP